MIKNELKKIVLESARVLTDESGRNVISAQGKDIKLSGDLLSNSNILNHIKKIKDYPILSEETGWDNSSSHTGENKNWIIDPLDGTFNYFRRIPFYGICIALWEGRKPVLGCYYDIPSDKYYYGEIGSNATLNNKVIQVSETSELNQAVLSTGFPSKLSLNSEQGRDYLEQMKTFKKVRMLGSAASSLALVAEGAIDVHYERNSMIWDVASGIALVLAAGGHVEYRFVDGGEKLNILACNKKLISKLKFITDTL